MNTLDDLLLAEQSRCRLLLRDYIELGSAAAFARALLEDGLKSAEEALRQRQALLMQRALDRLIRFQALNHLAIKVSHAGVTAPARRAPAAPLMRRAAPRATEQFFTWTQRAA